MEEEIKNSEDSIKEAQVEEVNKNEEVSPEESSENNSKKQKRDYMIELVLFLILGILIGVAIKTEAAKRITIGFDDYKMKIMPQEYDINKIQSDLAKKTADAASVEDQNAGAEGVPGDASADTNNAGSNNSSDAPSQDGSSAADQNNQN